MTHEERASVLLVDLASLLPSINTHIVCEANGVAVRIIKQTITAAVTEEREACAKVAEKIESAQQQYLNQEGANLEATSVYGHAVVVLQSAAAAIRARGEK